VSASLVLKPEKIVRLQLPRKLAFLLEMHPYKVLWGGRSSLKSWSIARTLLTLGIHQDLRILCAREVQKSLVESVHQLLTDQIKALDYGRYYDVTDNAIRGTANNTLFRFTGLAEHTVESMKSFEGFDIFWIEEAQAVKRRSWQVALPTLFRTAGSELWASFNPNLDTDEAWIRFVVSPPDGAVVVEMNWRDAVKCGWWSPEQERLRQYDLVHSKHEYPNIWDGKPSVVLAGAIYATEVIEMITENRYRPVPYDPKLPVHRVWDLGWNDLMTCIMVQKPHPSALNVINYLEESHCTYANFLGAMDQLHYRWGTDWLPDDANQSDPKSGTNARKLLVGLGCTVQMIPKSGPEPRIKAARMMWPRVYMDNSKFDTPSERPDRLLGAANLMDRLKRYKRNVPKTTLEPTGPVHDINSHGCFASDTNVLTRHGTYRIDCLSAIGEVLTPCGWKAYENPRITRRNARLVEVVFSDGLTVRCTPDHLFLTANGWKSAGSLRTATVIQSTLIQSPATSAAASTRCGPASGIWRRVESGFIAMFGGLHLALFRAGATFITAMATSSTMPFQIWSAFPRVSISRLSGESPSAMRLSPGSTSLTPHGPKRPNGISRKRAGCGTAEWRSVQNHGESGSAKPCPVSSAASRLKRWFGRVLNAGSSALQPAKPLRIASVEAIDEVADVWDITVPGVGCFSLENGAVVHNSDTFGGLAEIVDRIRNEGDRPRAKVRKFANVDPAMGMLG
jgi:phage terminase large subunit